MTTAATASEQRHAIRRQPTLGTIFRLGQDKGIGLVWNISTSGVSMLMSESQRAGETMRGELVAGDERAVRAVSVRVVHTRPVQTGDFFVGAQFETPIEAAEMQPFLA